MEAVKALSEVRTVDDSIAIRAPQMSLIKKEKGKDYVLGYIKLWIIYLQGNVNLKNKLTEGMIDLTAETILEDYWYASIADVKIIFSDALKGHYGVLYETLSHEKIITWFDSYFKEKFRKCEASSHSDHHYHSQASMGFSTSEREREYIVTTHNRLSSKEIKQVEKYDKARLTGTDKKDNK